MRFKINHNSDRVLGRTKSGTLRLSRDDKGLKFELDPPNTQDGRDLMELVRRGDISQMSFGFRTLDDDWSEDSSGNLIRTLKKLSLHNGDVSAVTHPAYPDTQIDVRYLEQIAADGRRRLGLGTRFDWRTDLARRRLALAELE